MIGRVAHFSRMRRWSLLAGMLGLCVGAGRAEFPEMFEGLPDHPAIAYPQPAHDAVAELNQKIPEGKVELRFADADHPEAMESKLALASLSSRFDTGSYLSPYSDIAALMVFDHQMRMMNLLTRLNWKARYGLYQHSVGLGTRLREGGQ
jgi:hypothetical protein